MKEHHGLEIESEAFKPKLTGFRWQKVGFGVLAILLLSSLLGLFGSGLLGKVRAGDQNISIEYDQFARAENATIVKIFVDKIQDNQIKISLSQDFVQHYHVLSIIPRPISEEIQNEQIIYRFIAQPSNTAVKIIFNLEPKQFGIAEGTFGNKEQKQFPIKQIIYP